MYVIVDPVKSKLILVRYGWVRDLSNFSDWTIKKEFKGKYLIYQGSAFKLQTIEIPEENGSMLLNIDDI
jgi:hypothetical protein